MDFSGRDHGGDTAVQSAVDPAELVLARRPVAGYGVNVAVDEARSHCRAVRVNQRARAFGVQVLLETNAEDLPIDYDDGVAIQDGPLQITAEKEADIADYELCGTRQLRPFVMSHRHQRELLDATHAKLVASLVSPVPMYRATCG